MLHPQIVRQGFIEKCSELGLDKEAGGIWDWLQTPMGRMLLGAGGGLLGGRLLGGMFGSRNPWGWGAMGAGLVPLLMKMFGGGGEQAAAQPGAQPGTQPAPIPTSQGAPPTPPPIESPTTHGSILSRKPGETNWQQWTPPSGRKTTSAPAAPPMMAPGVYGPPIPPGLDTSRLSPETQLALRQQAQRAAEHAAFTKAHGIPEEWQHTLAGIQAETPSEQRFAGESWGQQALDAGKVITAPAWLPAYGAYKGVTEGLPALGRGIGNWFEKITR